VVPQHSAAEGSAEEEGEVEEGKVIIAKRAKKYEDSEPARDLLSLPLTPDETPKQEAKKRKRDSEVGSGVGAEEVQEVGEKEKRKKRKVADKEPETVDPVDKVGVIDKERKKKKSDKEREKKSGSEERSERKALKSYLSSLFSMCISF